MGTRVTMHARLSAILVIAVIFVGCGATRATIAPMGAPAMNATESASRSPLPIISPTAPVPTPKGPAPTPTVGILLTPMSPPAEIGHSYAFHLLTHCGVNYHVDFDQSFWEATIPVWDGSGNPPPNLRNPIQDGTMTLLDADHARFDYAGGAIPFRRLSGPKIVNGLCG